MVSQSELSKKQTIDTSVQLRPLVDDCGGFGMFDKTNSWWGWKQGELFQAYL